MNNSKLYSLLLTFSTYDLLRFRKFITSPFFNENHELVQLFEVIKTDLTNKTGKTKDKLGFWSAIFADRPYNDTRFRRLCSDLLKLALDFLAYQTYQSNPSTVHSFLLHSLADTRLEKHFKGVVRQMEKDLAKSRNRDANYHYLSYALVRRQWDHREHNTSKTASSNFLKKADYHLDSYYLSKKLEHYCEALSLKSKAQSETPVQILPGLLEFLPDLDYFQEPSIKGWYLVALMMQNQEEEKYFQQLKLLVEKRGHCFQKKELHALFIHLMNYCIDIKINKGRSEYYLELLSLYKTALDQRIIFENDELNPHHYKNIITVSLHVKEFDWVERFIQEYSEHLPKADEQNALNYNLANLYFHKKEYDKVIELLREVEYKNIVYAIGSKTLLICTYYELNEDIALDSLTDSFRIFLRRNQLISKELRQRCMNMVRFTKKLSAIPPYDKEAVEKLKIQIENCKAVTSKKWLLEKVTEL